MVSVKYVWLVCLLIMIGVIAAGFEGAEGAGECGSIPVERMAIKLAPCASASQNTRAKVSASCCAEVQKLGKNPRCLCAVMLSNTAKSAGVKPAIAMTIPKRCNLAKRVTSVVVSTLPSYLQDFR